MEWHKSVSVSILKGDLRILTKTLTDGRCVSILQANGKVYVHVILCFSLVETAYDTVRPNYLINFCTICHFFIQTLNEE